jgi:hypothetical protein
VNVERLSEFLEALPGRHKYVFEFRDETWLVPEVYEILRKHKAAFCIHDFADMKIPNEITASFTYIRFHGPTRAKYFGSYSSAQLEVWAKRGMEQALVSDLRLLQQRSGRRSSEVRAGTKTTTQRLKNRLKTNVHRRGQAPVGQV